jgi:hypothetical protein
MLLVGVGTGMMAGWTNNMKEKDYRRKKGRR